MLRALPPLLAACLSPGAPSPAAPVPPGPQRPSPDGGRLIGYFVSPFPGEPLTVTFSRAGTLVKTATAPSGGFDVRLPPGRYQLSFATARGPVVGCDAELDVSPDRQTLVNAVVPPAACTVWIRFDEQHPLRANRGALADVQTKPGTYDGYRVLACAPDCDGGIVQVLGLGTEMPPENADRKSDGELNNWISRIRQRVQAATEPMASYAGGYGPSGRTGTPATMNVYVSDYRQVDELIARLGAVIREERLGITFTIMLVPIGSPL